MIIEKIELSDVVVEEVEGEYQVVKKNRETVPCMLTNYAIDKGHRLGLLKGSLTKDILEISTAVAKKAAERKRLSDVSRTEEETALDNIDLIKDVLDDEKLIAVLYIGCLGANPEFRYSHEDFVQRYHDDFETRIEKYMNLISGLDKKENKFAAEFQKNVSKGRAKGEKK